MRRRKRSNFKTTCLSYSVLEERKVLTSIMASYPASHFNTTVGESVIVLPSQDSEPEIVLAPENGMLHWNPDSGDLSYLPNEGFRGADSFEIGEAATAEKRALQVIVWEPVYAVTDWYRADPGATTTLDVLANDYVYRAGYEKAELDAGLKIVAVESQSGKLAISEDGNYLVYEAPGSFGQDVFSYTVSDENGNQSVTEVVVDIALPLDESSIYSREQWRQSKIENWMEQNAQHLGNNNRYYSLELPTIWRDVPLRGTIDFEPVRGVLAMQVDESVELGQFDFANDQVQNIQEGDILRVHGDRAYYISQHPDTGDSLLSIIDISDPASPSLLSTTRFNEQVTDLFVAKKRIAVVFEYFAGASERHGGREWIYQSNTTEMMVLDVSDRTGPAEVYRASVNGDYVDARLVGNQFYLISTSSDHLISYWSMASDPQLADVATPGAFIDRLHRAGQFDLPEIRVVAQGELSHILVAPEQVVNHEGKSSTTLISTFDLSSEFGRPVDIDQVSSDYTYEIYVSSEAIYLFDRSSVIKLNFNEQAPGISYSAAGELEGRIRGQLAADEHDGYLRVAVNENDGSSDVLVFEQQGDRLQAISKLDDIAPGEQIYSTYFTDEQLFVVTFRRIDPLFVIDLSDPNAIQIDGELKIPGVSNYLQLIQDDLLMSVGISGDNDGLTGRVQISLYDVSDSNAPALLDQFTFANRIETELFRSLFSAANHHAITYDLESGLLSLPIFTRGDWTAGQDDNSAMAVFQLSREDGIKSLGQVDFADRALRTAVNRDHLIYFSETVVQTAKMDDPTTVVGSLMLVTDARPPSLYTVAEPEGDDEADSEERKRSEDVAEPQPDSNTGDQPQAGPVEGPHEHWDEPADEPIDEPLGSEISDDRIEPVFEPFTFAVRNNFAAPLQPSGTPQPAMVHPAATSDSHRSVATGQSSQLWVANAQNVPSSLAPSELDWYFGVEGDAEDGFSTGLDFEIDSLFSPFGER